MKNTFFLGQRKVCSKVVAMLTIVVFVLSFLSPIAYVFAETRLNLPAPGEMVSVSHGFNAPMIKGMNLSKENALTFDFVIDKGDSRIEGDALSAESQKLVKYFLAALTIPDDEVWVNLSPYQEDTIIPHALGQTELGKDMLAQDYLLKQLTASLTSPQNPVGQDLWNKIYMEATKLYGTTEIPINTFSKVWIVPDKAVVVEKDQSVFIAESHLKVMLEKDYLALHENLVNGHNAGDETVSDEIFLEINEISASVMRKTVIPQLEWEINYGKNFAPVRQIFHSVILANWYKQNLKEGILSKAYVNQHKIAGINVDDETVTQKIYDQYLEALEEGVYNVTREDFDPSSQTVLERRYFSGGYSPTGQVTIEPFSAAREKRFNNDIIRAIDTGQLISLSAQFEPRTSGADVAFVVAQSSDLAERGVQLATREQVAEAVHHYGGVDLAEATDIAEVIQKAMAAAVPASFNEALIKAQVPRNVKMGLTDPLAEQFFTRIGQDTLSSSNVSKPAMNLKQLKIPDFQRVAEDAGQQTEEHAKETSWLIRDYVETMPINASSDKIQSDLRQRGIPQNVVAALVRPDLDTIVAQLAATQSLKNSQRAAIAMQIQTPSADYAMLILSPDEDKILSTIGLQTTPQKKVARIAAGVVGKLAAGNVAIAMQQVAETEIFGTPRFIEKVVQATGMDLSDIVKVKHALESRLPALSIPNLNLTSLLQESIVPAKLASTPAIKDKVAEKFSQPGISDKDLTIIAQTVKEVALKSGSGASLGFIDIEVKAQLARIPQLSSAANSAITNTSIVDADTMQGLSAAVPTAKFSAAAKIASLQRGGMQALDMNQELSPGEASALKTAAPQLLPRADLTRFLAPIFGQKAAPKVAAAMQETAEKETFGTENFFAEVSRISGVAPQNIIKAIPVLESSLPDLVIPKLGRSARAGSSQDNIIAFQMAPTSAVEEFVSVRIPTSTSQEQKKIAKVVKIAAYELGPEASVAQLEERVQDRLLNMPQLSPATKTSLKSKEIISSDASRNFKSGIPTEKITAVSKAASIRSQKTEQPVRQLLDQGDISGLTTAGVQLVPRADLVKLLTPIVGKADAPKLARAIQEAGETDAVGTPGFDEKLTQTTGIAPAIISRVNQSLESTIPDLVIAKLSQSTSFPQESIVPFQMAPIQAVEGEISQRLPMASLQDRKIIAEIVKEEAYKLGPEASVVQLDWQVKERLISANLSTPTKTALKTTSIAAPNAVRNLVVDVPAEKMTVVSKVASIQRGGIESPEIRKNLTTHDVSGFKSASVQLMPQRDIAKTVVPFVGTANASKVAQAMQTVAETESVGTEKFFTAMAKLVTNVTKSDIVKASNAIEAVIPDMAIAKFSKLIGEPQQGVPAFQMASYSDIERRVSNLFPSASAVESKEIAKAIKAEAYALGPDASLTQLQTGIQKRLANVPELGSQTKAEINSTEIATPTMAESLSRDIPKAKISSVTKVAAVKQAAALTNLGQSERRLLSTAGLQMATLDQFAYAMQLTGGDQLLNPQRLAQSLKNATDYAGAQNYGSPEFNEVLKQQGASDVDIAFVNSPAMQENLINIASHTLPSLDIGSGVVIYKAAKTSDVAKMIKLIAPNTSDTQVNAISGAIKNVAANLPATASMDEFEAQLASQPVVSKAIAQQLGQPQTLSKLSIEIGRGQMADLKKFSVNQVAQKREIRRTALARLPMNQLKIVFAKSKIPEDDIQMFEELRQNNPEVFASSANLDVQLPKTIRAALAQPSSQLAMNLEKVGGINFSANMINMKVVQEGGGVSVPLPTTDADLMNIDGLYPVIINIAPATIQSVPFLSSEETNEKTGIFELSLK
ncbi:MAG: hypothetical protein KAR05_05250 [Candidatus Omnitrophica bacterium]|nr:hypothetical protein [Candidatus Omnitrophota bacterium]